jgi:membrane protease YdiL (CAAX protease family)
MNGENPYAPFGKINPVAFVFISLLIVFLTYQIIGSIILLVFLGYSTDISVSNVGLVRIIITFSQFLLIFFPVILLNALRGWDFRETFFIKKPDVKIFFLAVAGIVVIQPFLQLFMYLQNLLIFSIPFGQEILEKIKLIFDTFEKSTLSLVTSYSIPEFLVVILAIALTPAICEEFLFRGLIFKNFNKSLSLKASVFYTGLIFALFHFHPFNLLPLILLGVYLTFVVYYSESIFTSVVCHFINNFISAYVVFIFGYDITSSENMKPDEINQLIISGIISLIIFVLILYFIVKVFKKNKQKNIISVGNG